ncbi:MAG: alkaline phosphatase family protein, partial [Bacteroidetes bacterium]|nr:alkaline phosphatase family protein [Bacteroidota bacterium]
IILMGLDALTWVIMNPLVKEGKLPHISSLLQRGSYGPLKTLCPALSPELWSSISTGKLPYKHGIEGFVTEDSVTKKLVPYTSNMRKSKAIWEILGDYNKTVGVVGWWNSWPAEPVNGYMVCGILGYKAKDLDLAKRKKDSSADLSDEFVELTRKSRLRTTSFEKQTYPESLFENIKPLIRPTDKLDDIHEFLKNIWNEQERLSTVEEDSLRLITSVYNIDRSYKDIALHIKQQSNPDFLTFYMAGIDVAGHKYWAYMEPERFSVDIEKDKIRRYGKLIPDYYTYIDEVVGEFLKTADEDTIIALVSDHGMSGNERVFKRTRINSARHFDEDGVFIFAGPGVRKNNPVRSLSSVLDITPTLLALSGFPVAMDMDGDVIHDIFTPEFKLQYPFKYINSYDGNRRYSSNPIESPIDDEIKKRLQSLGYID